MFIQTWGEVFTASLQSLWAGFISFVPSLVIALIIFIIGWVVGSLISKIVSQIIAALKVDKFFESIGADEVIQRAGFKLNVGKFIGELIKWFVVVVFLMTSLEILGLNQVNSFLREVVVQYLPQVIIAALILVIATVVADAIKKIVAGSAKAANVRSANLLGSIANYAVWIFALIIALSQLGIAPQFMQILFTGLIGMLALAGGLAFGLGGKDAAGRAVDRMGSQISNKNQ